jgi:hypothetical protein
VEKREMRADTIACALEGWGESKAKVRVKGDATGRYLLPPLDSALKYRPLATKKKDVEHGHRAATPKNHVQKRKVS